MWTLLALSLASTSARAETVIRNDTSYDDTYDTSDQVAWLESPECAATVFDPDDYDLPLTVDIVQIYLGSSSGDHDGEDTLAEVGLKILAEGEEPSLADMDWAMEGFNVTVNSTAINELSLVDEENGLFALEWTEGWLSVVVCAPDADSGYQWPTTSASNTSGIVIDTDSPGAYNYVYFNAGTGYDWYSFNSIGLRGAWIIRAVASDGGGTDTGSGSSGGSSGGGSSGGSSSGGSSGGGSSGGSSGGGDTGEVAIDLLSVAPEEAVEGEAVDVTVIGVGFDEGAQVYIGGMAISQPQVHGDSAITGRAPTALPAGVHDVMVTNPDGTTDTMLEAFTVSAPAVEEDKGGCGCASGPRAGGWAAVALLGLVVGRRRQARVV